MLNIYMSIFEFLLLVPFAIGLWFEKPVLITVCATLFIIIPFLGILGVYGPMPNEKVEPTAFFDGNNKKIPNHIIELEVKSHFSKMKPSELDSINKYFYFDTLK